MKRRLSLGIALVGDPQIVFLDEPTTGLDPGNKRQIWEILHNAKRGKCMILTTHLMDEAEVLCDRIGIIIKGEMKCLGTQFELQTNYGKGFKLCLNLRHISIEGENKDVFGAVKVEEEKSRERINVVSAFITNIFNRAKPVESYKNTLIFEILNQDFDPHLLFEKLKDNKEKLEITNWGISQVSLEDIFIRLTEKEVVKERECGM